MEPSFFPNDDRSEPPMERARGRQLIWLLSLVCRYRLILVLGLLSTIAFAALHTISIGAAFPVFKVLLEKEGIQGWLIGPWRASAWGRFSHRSASRIRYV